jgi:crossover junction endodeoxyribonuclease RuvC
MIFCGIDPGLNGAMAFFDIANGKLKIIDMPTVEVLRNNKKKREVSAPLLASELRNVGPINMTFVERVNAMPGQGVTSVFSFGRSSGIIEGVLATLAMPYTIEPPQKWQKALNVRDGKDGSRLRAGELFPKYAENFSRKKDDGRADAALMAYYIATR